MCEEDNSFPTSAELSPWLRELLRLGLYPEALLIVDSLNQADMQRIYSAWRSRRIQHNVDEVCSLPIRFVDLRSADPGAAAEAASIALGDTARSRSDRDHKYLHGID